MNDLNLSQKAIVEKTEGMMVVDAGPGTGKTHTVVERFVRILNKSDVDPRDILLLTFTKNAADEMGDRIKNKLAGTDMAPSAKFIQTGTFDSFCFSVVMESPEAVSRFFKTDEKLTRGARLVENETLNREHFSNFFDGFLANRGEEYGTAAVVASQHVNEIFRVIRRLMSKGMAPLKNGWFGKGGESVLTGDPALTYSMMRKKYDDTEFAKFMNGAQDRKYGPSDCDPDDEPDKIMKAAAEDDRRNMLDLIHDVHYEYIRRCIIDDRLTFEIVACFAFVILYSDAGTRKRMSCRYLMIDEFQDTNDNQLMIALMLLKEPNLCVVGDWKQGIYGFRFASIDNIIHFEKQARELSAVLNDDVERVPYKIPEVRVLPLKENYRSSQKVIDTAYKCLLAPADGKEIIDEEYLKEKIVEINAERDDIGEDTSVVFVRTESKEEEITETLRRIEGYVNGDYTVHDGNASRKPDYGDIAVLCRTVAMCRSVYEAAVKADIPAFLQGDVEVMSSREGKLVLAWLRYLNNRNDRWGIGAILADRNHSLSDIEKMLNGTMDLPDDIPALRKSLFDKKRRITDLVATVYASYGLNNDITQTIISVLSAAHRNSLLTISDLISMIEADIEAHTKYNVDGSLNRRAVTIQTMHKSKGLEYPIVIIAGMDSGTLPSTKPDDSAYPFHDIAGVRCRKDVFSFGDGRSGMFKSWKTDMVLKAIPKDRSEERRLLFVAVSRAKQYVTLVSGPKPSPFFEYLRDGESEPPGSGSVRSSCSEDMHAVVSRPAIDAFEKRRKNVGVHDILRFDNDFCPEEGSDEYSGKGMEYGTKIHELAHALALDLDIDSDLPEITVIKGILSSLNADMVLPEIECSLPVDKHNVTLRGVIDLLVLYPDRVVIRDYKTDAELRYIEEYKIQLSVYAHAASSFYNLPAECVLDYVSRNETYPFEPLEMDVIASRVGEYLNK